MDELSRVVRSTGFSRNPLSVRQICPASQGIAVKRAARRFRLKAVLRTLGTLGLFCLAGCESLGTTKKFKNPVVPPPPQRIISRDDDRYNDDADADGRPLLSNSEDSEKGNSGDTRQTSATADPKRGGPRNRLAAPRPMARGQRSPEGPGHAPLSESEAGDDKGVITRTTGTAPADQNGWKKPGSASRLPPADNGNLPPDDERQRELTAVRRTTETDVDSFRLDHGEVAALVNGTPIFVEDVLHDHRIQQWLEQARKAGKPPEFIRAARKQMVEQRLSGFIQQELLVQALKQKVPDGQLDKMLAALDKQFDTEAVPKLIKESGASTRGELENKLREVGRSLEVERQKFRNTQMAQQYIGMMAKPHSGFDRPDIVDHYQQNQDRYLVQGEVLWQQIRLTYGRNGRDKQQTIRLAHELLEKLQNGEEFAVLARQYSDGSTRADGGRWPWTVEGSLSSQELDEALFNMPVGEELALIESDKTIDIVMVLDRHERGYKSFHSVQQDIHNELRQAQAAKNVQTLLKELEENAHIERYLDRM